MFIQISNFGHGTGIFLPPNLQDPKLKNPENTSSVVCHRSRSLVVPYYIIV